MKNVALPKTLAILSWETRLIHLQDIHLSFGDLEVLKNVQLDIYEGDSLVVLGPSGHGKSVLLKVIAGILPPDQGRVEIKADKPLSMLFQKNALFDSMSNMENLTFPMNEVGIVAEDINKEAEKYLEAVGLRHASQLYPDEISGGMQKRLGIARALSVRPKVILYDDPTAGLDPITSRDIAKLIRHKQKEENSTIVCVTNDMARAKQLGERYLFVFSGKLWLFDTFQELWASDNPIVHQFIRGLTEGPLSEQNT